MVLSSRRGRLACLVTQPTVTFLAVTRPIRLFQGTTDRRFQSHRSGSSRLKTFFSTFSRLVAVFVYYAYFVVFEYFRCTLFLYNFHYSFIFFYLFVV